MMYRKGIKKELLKYWKKNKKATLEELGQRFLVTRERIRQILTKEKGYKKSRKNKPSKRVFLEAKCQYCHKTFTHITSRLNPKYCNKKCFVASKIKYKTLDERLEARRKSMRAYHQRTMMDPLKRKKRQEYNRMYIRNRIKKEVAKFKDAYLKKLTIAR